MLEEYDQCDGVYLFSDGLMNDPLKTLKHVEKWMEESPDTVPAIHTIGFFPIGSDGGNGARFLKQLALMTGGTYKVEEHIPAHICMNRSTEFLCNNRSTATPGV